MTKLIIFDLDGTLLNISERYYRSTKFALKKFGFKCPSKTKIIELKRQNLSGPQLIDLLIPKNIKKRDEIKKTLNKIRYQILHNKKFLYLDRPFNGVYKTLKRLKEKKIKLVVLTGRFYRKETIEQLKKLRLIKFFDEVVVDKLNTVESKLILIRKICKKFSVSYDDCWLVGDSLIEIEAGNLLGIQTIGATYGLLSKEILYKKCKKIISDIKELNFI